jgi:hypothetical protein
MQRSATHNNTTTQQHSIARSLPHTAAHGNQRAIYTHTSEHAAPQLHTPLQCTPKMLVSTVVTHNGGAAWHTHSPPQAAASSAATPHTAFNTQAQHARRTSRTAATTAHCASIARRTPPHARRHTTRHTARRTPHTAHRKTPPVTHAASAPHSPKIRQAGQRRRDAAGELVAAQVQLSAGHTNSHRVTPWHPTPPPPTPASRP